MTDSIPERTPKADLPAAPDPRRPYSTCGCGKKIEEAAPGVYRSVEHPTADRVACTAGGHRPLEPAHVELPIQAGDVTALGLPQETGGAG